MKNVQSLYTTGKFSLDLSPQILRHENECPPRRSYSREEFVDRTGDVRFTLTNVGCRGTRLYSTSRGRVALRDRISLSFPAK